MNFELYRCINVLGFIRSVQYSIGSGRAHATVTDKGASAVATSNGRTTSPSNQRERRRPGCGPKRGIIARLSQLMPLESLSGRERSWLPQPFESRACRPVAVCTMRETRLSGRLSATKTQKEAAMATRGSSREEKLETPRRLRRSLRLEMKVR